MHYSDLGFSSYKEYLKSPHWQKVNEQYFYQSNRPKYCYICDLDTNLLLHHESYNHLGDEDIYRDLVCVCFDCHKAIHFNENGQKVPNKTVILKKRKDQLRRQYLLKNFRPSTAIPITKQLLFRLFW